MDIVEIDQIPEAKNVPFAEPMLIYETCQQMARACEQSDGIGLAAVQVGVPWKLFIIKSDGGFPLIPKDHYGYFVNCDYEPTTEKQVVSLEGCLSVRSPKGQLRLFQVNRFTNIRLYGFRLIIDDMNKANFVPLDIELSFYEQGVVFQHEIDHQRGQLISDLGKEVFLW